MYRENGIRLGLSLGNKDAFSLGWIKIIRFHTIQIQNEAGLMDVVNMIKLYGSFSQMAMHSLHTRPIRHIQIHSVLSECYL